MSHRGIFNKTHHLSITSSVINIIITPEDMVDTRRHPPHLAPHADGGRAARMRGVPVPLRARPRDGGIWDESHFRSTNDKLSEVVKADQRL